MYWGGPVGARVYRRERLEDEIEDGGYAVRNGPSRRFLANPDYFNWFYPSFGMHHAYHFVSELFGRLHALSIIGETIDTYQIAFCPLGVGPSIEGTLTVSKDLILESADWSFRTPEPVEHAGGEAIFAPWATIDDGLPHLVPIRSLYWRRMQGRELFYQRSSAFVCWIVGPDAAAPSLPSSPPAGSRGILDRQ